MKEAGGNGRGRWSTAVGLTLAVAFLSVVDALALVLIPLVLLVIGLPARRNRRWVLVAAALAVFALLLSAGPLGILSRGWALMLGSTYLVVTLIRPRWDVVTRSLAVVGITMLAGSVGLLATGQGGSLDEMVREHFETVSTVTLADLQTRMPESAWLADLRAATERIGTLQTRLFPALLGLQSLAALALASWWIRRMGRSRSRAFRLDPLREFRFPDELIWILIGALALTLVPVWPGASRVALNVLVFMGALYALRGLAIFVFLATGSRSIPTMVLGTIALVFLYPVAFTAALLMGVGDTWLDVRRRVVLARPT